jgi:hypothetical protein
MSKENKNKNVAGGSPSRSGPEDDSKQEDDSKKPSKQIEQEGIKQSESGNMTDKRGYNETDPKSPVKSVKK